MSSKQMMEGWEGSIQKLYTWTTASKACPRNCPLGTRFLEWNVLDGQLCAPSTPANRAELFTLVATTPQEGPQNARGKIVAPVSTPANAMIPGY